MRAATTPPRLTTLILLSALSVIPVNLFLPSLPAIAGSFGVDVALVTLAVTAYAGTAAVLQLVLGPLSDRFGRRPVLLASLAVFVLASLGAALATDLWSFLAFRVLQAAIVAGHAVSLAVIRDSVPPQEAAGRIGTLATAWALAPMLAPSVGGVLDQLFGWRACFWAFAGLGAGVLILAWLDLGETNRAPSASLPAQLRAYPALLRARRFWAYALCMAFSVGAFYAFLAGAPAVAAALFDMPPAMLGVAMGSITGGFMLGSFLASRYARHLPLATTVIAGRLVACGGLSTGLVLVALVGPVNPLLLFGPCLCIGIGNGLTMPGCSAGVLSVRPDLAGSAAGLAGALTVAGGAAMASVTGAVLAADTNAAAWLTVMLATSLAGLLCALEIRRLDRRQESTSNQGGQA